MYLPSYINFIYTQTRTRINHDYSQLIVIKLNKSTFLKMKKNICCYFTKIHSK